MDRIKIEKRAYDFALRIIGLCKFLQKDSIGRLFTRQLFKSGTSIGANTEEAQAAQSKKDFIAKISIARKEAREALYWLRLIRESGVVSEDRISGLITECDELNRILTSIVLSAKGSSNS